MQVMTGQLKQASHETTSMAGNQENRDLVAMTENLTGKLWQDSPDSIAMKKLWRKWKNGEQVRKTKKLVKFGAKQDVRH
jgi:hypothetical protein